MVPENGITDPGQFVGQGTRRFVVVRSRLNLGGPDAQAIERFASPSRQFGGT